MLKRWFCGISAVLLIAGLASGCQKSSDIDAVNADSVKPFHAKGYFYDLSGIPAYELLNESAREQSTVNGTAYTIPLQMTAYGMYVNVGLLREHGLEPPKNPEEFLRCWKVSGSSRRDGVPSGDHGPFMCQRQGRPCGSGFKGSGIFNHDEGGGVCSGWRS